MTPEIKVMPLDYSILSQILNVKKKAIKISKQIYLYIQVLIKSQLCARQCSEYWDYSSTQPKSPVSMEFTFLWRHSGLRKEG